MKIPALLLTLALPLSACSSGIEIPEAHAPSAKIYAAPAFIPLPSQAQVAQGPGFALGETLPVLILSKDQQSAAEQAVLTSLALAGVKTSASTWSTNALYVTLDESKKETLGAEGYSLAVTPAGITLVAATPAGLFHGAQTLAQGIVRDAEGNRAIPALTITDAPRFAWRGLMLDSGRHFIKPADVKRMIDLMAMHKFNTLHWHLTEDQGWRIEIKKYPKLTSIGSIRPGNHIPGKSYTIADNKPYGGFYTQEEIKDIVAYAKERFVTIIPEIEMPGHAAAAIAAYPEFGNKDIGGYNPAVQTAWGVHSYTFAPSEETFTFIDDVIGEVAALFPDAPYIHVGGDECPKDQWNRSAFAKKVMVEKNFKNAHELQSYFISRAEKSINARGKRIIGWDEIQEGGLSKTATMMVWRNWKWAVEAVNHGNDVVMAPSSHTYINGGQGQTPEGPGFQNQGGTLSLEKVYNFEPVPAELTTPEQIRHVLGCQGQLWSEYITSQPKLEYMAFPRACALAEVAWTPKDKKNKEDFMKRLEGHLPMLDAKKVNYRKADGAEAQPGSVDKALGEAK